MSDWRDRAACAGIDTNEFFPENTGRRDHWVIGLCIEDCPVRRECAQDAFPDDLRGIRGGVLVPAMNNQGGRRRAIAKLKAIAEGRAS